jgi:hypothetical protein
MVFALFVAVAARNAHRDAKPANSNSCHTVNSRRETHQWAIRPLTAHRVDSTAGVEIEFFKALSFILSQTSALGGGGV